MKLFDQYRGLRREIYVLFFCKFIDSAGSVVGPMLTLILSTKLGMDAKEIALVFFLYTLVSLPMNLLGGKLTDRVNKRLLINVCDIASSLVYIACGLIGFTRSTLIVFMVGCLLQGLESPAYDTLVADFTTSADRDRAYSVLYLGNNLGFILAPIFGGLLINRYLSLMFVFSGVFELISLLLFDFNVKSVEAVRDESNVYETAEVPGGSVLRVLRSGGVLIPFLFVFSLSMLVYSMWSYLIPLSLTTVHGEAGPVFFGTMSSVNGATVLLCTAALTMLFARRTSFERMIAGNLCELAGFVIFLLFLGRPFFYYLAIFVFTLGEILNTITTNPYLTRRIPMHFRGRVSAITHVCTACVDSLGRLGIGALYDSLGYRAAWTCVLLLGVLATLGYLFLTKKDRAVYPELYRQDNG